MKSEKKIVGKVQSIDVFNKRIDNLIAMRNIDCYDEWESEPNELYAKLVTNGAVVLAQIDFSHHEAMHYYQTIPEKFRPIGEIEIYRDGDYHAFVHPGRGEGDPPFIEGYVAPEITDLGTIAPITVICQYPVKDMSIAEMEDARVGYDGKVHDTLGTAIREQVKTMSEGIVRVEFDGADSATLDSMEIYNAFTAGKLPVLCLESYLFLPQEITEDKATFTATILDSGKNPILSIVSVNAAGVIEGDGIALGGSSSGDLGDIEEALDKIIELQNTLIGGGAK